MLLVTAMSLFMISCSNYSYTSNQNSAADASQGQSGLSVQSEHVSDVQKQSSISSAVSSNLTEAEAIDIIQSPDNKVCYNLTEQVTQKDYTITDAKFIDDNTIAIIQNNVRNTNNHSYFVSLYDVNQLKLLKTLQMQMNAGRGYTFCSVGENSIISFDGIKGTITIYDFDLTVLKEIPLPKGYDDYKIALTKDFTSLACVTKERKSIEIYDTTTYEPVITLDKIILPGFDGDLYCTGLFWGDNSNLILSLQTQAHESCMAIYDIKTDELYKAVDGALTVTQSGESLIFKNDWSGSFNPQFTNRCDVFMIKDIQQKIAELIPIPEQYINAENICFNRNSGNKLIIDFSDDYSTITLNMLNPDDSLKTQIALTNREDEFEPINIQNDNAFSEDGETIVLLSRAQDLYLIKSTD